MIEINNLSEEEISTIKKYFLEKRIIQIKDILSPIEEYFWKFDFNTETQNYELFLGIPKDWLHDMSINGYTIELFNETENGKIIKLITTSKDYVGDLDEMVLFAVDIIQRNNTILAKIREKELELQVMKDKMIEVQMALDREIEQLKIIKNGDDPDEENQQEQEKELEVVESDSTTYVKPIEITKEETDKFVELVRNGKQ